MDRVRVVYCNHSVCKSSDTNGDAASSEGVLTSLDLFAVGTFALASLSLVRSKIKNGSVCVVVAFGTNENKGRVCINFCQKVGNTCSETYNMMKMAFGEDSISRSLFFEMFRRFKEGGMYRSLNVIMVQLKNCRLELILQLSSKT